MKIGSDEMIAVLSHLPVTGRVGVLTAISHSAVHNLLLGKSVHRRIGRCQESWELASQIGSDEMIAVLSHLPVTGRVGGLIALPLVLYNLLLEKCAHRRIGRCQESWELAIGSDEMIAVLSHLPVTGRVGVLTAISHSAVHNLLLGKSVHRRIGRCQESWELASQIGSDEMIAVLSHLPVTGRVGVLTALPLVVLYNLLRRSVHIGELEGVRRAGS
ncbi:hypothetical protein J6590_035757 [Homalodisca vitripennis]|nr:hypothetical protein J6590_035757 [Homalodisca vitripennis]